MTSSEIVTRELIQSIIDDHERGPDSTSHSLSGRIIDELQRINRITLELAKLRHEEAAEVDRHAVAVAAIDARRLAIRRECRHPRVTRHGDPSGGFSGFSSCELCGAEL